MAIPKTVSDHGASSCAYSKNEYKPKSVVTRRAKRELSEHSIDFPFLVLPISLQA